MEKLTFASEKGETRDREKRKERGRDIGGEKDGGKQPWPRNPNGVYIAMVPDQMLRITTDILILLFWRSFLIKPSSILRLRQTLGTVIR